MMNAVYTEKVEAKIVGHEKLLQLLKFWRTLGDRIVFTNGCFDILHAGHIHLLASCSAFGERLVLGLNSDSSVKKLKGNERPVNKQQDRALVLAALQFTDAIIVFDEETPLKLIEAVKPDVLVKGGDWKKTDIVGSSFVESYGGNVQVIPYLDGYSSTEIIKRSAG